MTGMVSRGGPRHSSDGVNIAATTATWCSTHFTGVPRLAFRRIDRGANRLASTCPALAAKLVLERICKDQGSLFNDVAH